MTPEQRFNRWVQTALLVFAVAFVYFIVADTHMPMTPESRLLRPVVPVAPQVGGRVSEVLVDNNQHVRQGEVLFRIDDRSYRLAVVDAELALEQAERENQEFDAQIASAEAALRAARVEADNQARDLKRYQTLAARQSIAAQVRDQTLAAYHAAEAQVSAAQAKLSELRTQRGESGQENLRLRQARNRLEHARLELDYTEVRADLDGVVSNLQLSAGDYVATGSAALALVGDHPDLVADFREKSLRYTHPGTQAAVAFDGLPGQVFAARVEGYDAGVRDGQFLADGTLAAPAESDRWVRDAQRMRIHVSLVELPKRALPTGARATVQLYPGDNPLARLLGRAQIRLISLIHYVY